MYYNKKILAIIPARGGSKGLPGKNIKPLLGKPLIGWTIEQAQASQYIDEIYVSTDSEEIAAVANSFGVSVPELRPEVLAGDQVTSAAVVLHILDKLKKEDKEFDYFMLLEPTSPLRKNDDLDLAIQIAIQNPTKSGVTSIGEVHMEHPLIVKKIDADGKMTPYIDTTTKINQRQQTDKAYFPYGVVYLVKVEDFIQNNQFYGENTIPYIIERWQCYEMDDIYDFLAIEAILNYQIKN